MTEEELESTASIGKLIFLSQIISPITNCFAGQIALERASCTDHFSTPENTVKTPNKRKIGRALFFSYREFSLTGSFSNV